MAGLEKMIISFLNHEVPECRPGTLVFDHLMSCFLTRRSSAASKCEIISGLIRTAMLEREYSAIKVRPGDI